MNTDLARARGLVSLLRDAVVHGASAIERVHMATARRPFAVLEAIPIVAGPTVVVRVVHDVTVAGVYGAIRMTAHVVCAVAEAALRHGSKGAPKPGAGSGASCTAS
jgi:hypothetical protein